MFKPDMLGKICLHEESIFALALATKFTTWERSCMMNSEEMQAHFRQVFIVEALKPVPDCIVWSAVCMWTRGSDFGLLRWRTSFYSCII
jgi:hypothetical protein